MVFNNPFFDATFFEDLPARDNPSVMYASIADAFQSQITFAQYIEYVEQKLEELLPSISLDAKTIENKVITFLAEDESNSLVSVENALGVFANFTRVDKDFAVWVMLCLGGQLEEHPLSLPRSSLLLKTELMRYIVKHGTVDDIMVTLSYHVDLGSLNCVVDRSTWSHLELDAILSCFTRYKAKRSVVRSIYTSAVDSISDTEVEVLKKHYILPALDFSFVQSKAIEQFDLDSGLPRSAYEYSLAFNQKWNPAPIQLDAEFDFTDDTSVEVILTKTLECLPPEVEEYVDSLLSELPKYSFEFFIQKLSSTQPWLVAPLLLKFIALVVDSNGGTVNQVEVKGFFNEVENGYSTFLFSTIVRYLEENVPYFIIAALLKFYCYPLRFARWTNAEGKLFITCPELSSQVLEDVFNDDRIIAFFKEMHGSRGGLYLAEKFFQGLGNFSLGVDFPPPAIDVIEPYLGIMFFNAREVAAFGRWKNPKELEELPDSWIAKLLWETYSSTNGVPYKNR